MLAERRREGKRGRCCCWELGPQYRTKWEPEMFQLEPPKWIWCAWLQEEWGAASRDLPRRMKEAFGSVTHYLQTVFPALQYMAPCLEFATWRAHSRVQSSAMSLSPTCVLSALWNSPGISSQLWFPSLGMIQKQSMWERSCSAHHTTRLSAFRAPTPN